MVYRFLRLWALWHVALVVLCMPLMTAEYSCGCFGSSVYLHGPALYESVATMFLEGDWGAFPAHVTTTWILVAPFGAVAALTHSLVFARREREQRARI